MMVEDSKAVAQEFFDGVENTLMGQMVPNQDKVRRELIKLLQEANKRSRMLRKYEENE